MTADGPPRVGEYMTTDVATVAPSDTVADVARRIVESDDFSGFPVCDGRKVEGFVSARDLLLGDDDTPMRAVMSDELLVAHPDMAVQDAARVILRSGIQKLPVVDDDGNLIGIISNADVIRSQIERATPDKVDKLSRTLESIHDVGTSTERREVELAALTPTQDTVYADELEGRSYELERGLAEPLVVIDNTGRRAPGQATVQAFDRRQGRNDPRPGSSVEDQVDDRPRRLLLADGHHRAKAADTLGIEEMDAYVIVLEDNVDLGMARTAGAQNLETIEDVEVVDYARHPLVESTERLQGEE